MFPSSMPFVRLLIAFVAGILLQWYLRLFMIPLLILFATIVFFLLLFSLLPFEKKFSFRFLQGVAILLLVIDAGAMVMYVKDIRNQPNQISSCYKKSDIIEATLLEPLVEKPKTFKALALINNVFRNGVRQDIKAKILIYFKSDTALKDLTYGSQIIFNKPLESITNSGNPGEFDYKTYCLFQGIEEQVFLSSKNYILLPGKQTNWLQSFLFSARSYIIETLRQNIPGKKEQSVAEALLIGYREDIDKTLLEAYRNTGVIHIIVISGLHMGMVYGLAVWLISFFKTKKWHRFIKPLIVLIVIWLFVFITGARPSILRVATMLSFVVIGEALKRRSNVYNSLAASAFCLLLVDPFFLWDAGFQLSFAAVASIVTFYKPVYHRLHFENRLVNKVWQLTALTISVQFFTLPLVLYYFHRFPTFFLFANFIAVPLACFCLYLELLLLLISKWKWLAAVIGKTIAACIWIMNRSIENTNRLPFSYVDNIYQTFFQTIVLLICIIAFATWLLRKSTKSLLIGLGSLSLFIVAKDIVTWQDKHQRKLIVYNIYRHSAVDILEGNNFIHFGDDATQNPAQQDFYLTPSRISFHANEEEDSTALQIGNHFISSNNKNIFILNKTLPVVALPEKIPMDVIIVSYNPRISMSDVVNVFNCKEIIFDSSNPPWKIAQWTKECDSLHLPFHSVARQGAFVMDL